jgi:hypothetical protein
LTEFSLNEGAHPTDAYAKAVCERLPSVSRTTGAAVQRLFAPKNGKVIRQLRLLALLFSLLFFSK